MSIILAQNLVRQGKSVEEAAKIAGVGEEMLRGLMGMPQKKENKEPTLNRTTTTQGSSGKKKVEGQDPSAIKSEKPRQKEEKKEKPKKRKLLKELIEKYPECFNWEDPKPLKIGIHIDIMEELKDVTPKEMRDGLKKYVRQEQYLEKIIAGRKRYDLAGKESGEIEDRHQKDAEAMLAARARWKEKKEAEKAEQGVSEAT